MINDQTPINDDLVFQILTKYLHIWYKFSYRKHVQLWCMNSVIFLQLFSFFYVGLAIQVLV